MKFNLVLIIIVLSCNSYSQEYNKIYFDENWIITSMEDAKYYRISGFDNINATYNDSVFDYYIENNQLEMKGKYVGGIKKGEFIFFYPNGKNRMVINYNNNEKEGYWSEYYPNNEIKVKVEYINGEEELQSLNDSSGNSIIIKNKFEFKTLFYNTLPYSLLPYTSVHPEDITIKGFYLDNHRNGKWKVYKNNKLFSILKYENGKLVEGVFFTNYLDTKLTGNFNLIPLINDPIKFIVTEKFISKPNAVIKNNYVLQGLFENRYATMEKFSIKDYNELGSYIKDHFDFRSKTRVEKLKIFLKVNNHRIVEIFTEPKISAKSIKDLKTILSPIDKINYQSDSIIIVDYIMEYEEEIGTKK